MAKTIKFNLILDGKPVRDIKGLQENFCINDVLELYQNGLLQKWLKVRGYDDYLKKVQDIKKDESVIIQLIKIFDIEKSEKEIKEAVYSLEFWEERKIELEEWNKKNTKIKDIIADYHNGYDVLLSKISEKKEDMAFMKAAAKEIVDKYLDIFKIDYPLFFANYKEDSPLMIYAVLMNNNLRNFFLEDEDIKLTLQNEFSDPSMLWEKLFKYTDYDDEVKEEYIKLTLQNEFSDPSMLWEKLFKYTDYDDEVKEKYIELASQNEFSDPYMLWEKLFNSTDYEKEYNENKIIDMDKKLGPHIFKGVTDGYWKDLEVAKTKVMVLSIPEGTYIRSANKPKEELSSKDVNGKFLILDGLLYKSNTNESPIVYMEV